MLSVGNFKISTRIFTGFGIVLAILVGLVVYVDGSLKEGLEKQVEYQRRSTQMSALLDAKGNFIEVRRAITMFLLKGGGNNRN